MDPDNIFHILMGNQDPAQQSAPQAPSNVLQGAPPAPDAPQAPSNVLQSVAPPQALPAPQDVAQAAVAASPPVPKPRRSLLDTIGRISDVLATVGGAQALYQPTLDAARNRLQQVDLNKLDLATKQAALTGAQNTNADSERSRFTNVLGAINDAEDAAKLPQMMQAAGLTDARYAPFIKMVQDDPDQAKVLSSALGGGEDDAAVKYGGNIIYGKDANGTIHAYQANITGGNARDVLPEGITPVDPQQFVDTGGAHVGVGKLSGRPQIILPNSPKPDTVLTTNTSRENNQTTNRTNLTIAGMPARPKEGAAATAKASDPRAGLKIISDIQQSFDNLHNLKALPGDGGSAIGNVLGAVGRTHLGQAIGASTGLSSAAQERELLSKNLANLQSDLIKSLPGNATRTRFEQEIQKKRLPDPTTMSYDTANRAVAQIRDAYLTALRNQPTAAPTKAGPQASSGWTVVGVK